MACVAALAGKVSPSNIVVANLRGRGDREHVVAAGTPDLLGVRLRTADLMPLEWALSIHQKIGCPEIFFIADDVRTDGATFAGLRALGFKRLIPLSMLERWLCLTALPLARLARARRTFQEAERILDDISSMAVPLDAPNGLFLEEQRFRETYLRALLAETGSRRLAADRARVPYRSFCQMLQKAGIEDDLDPSADVLSDDNRLRGSNRRSNIGGFSDQNLRNFSPRL